MIRVKTELHVLQKGRIGVPHHRTSTVKKEIQFLKSLCVRNEDKGSLQDSIPKGVQNLDLGYLWVPLPPLYPFLVSVDEAFQRHVKAGPTFQFLVSGDPTVGQLIPAFSVETCVFGSRAYA